MTIKLLRTGFAALLASVTLSSAAQAQIELGGSNPSGVTVSLRQPSNLYFPQLTSAKPNQEDSAKPADAKDADKDSKPDDSETEKKDDASKDESESKSPRASEGGRLSPITMESVRAPIGAANISVVDIGTKVLPDDQAAKQMVPRLPLPGGRDRALEGLTYRWQAANICHLPLYFEEPMLERHGQQCCPTWIQPAVSGSKFLSNLILFPYKATLHPTCENRYTLGHFRPGSGAPCLKDTLPWSADAALVQAAATTAVFVGLPW